MSQESDFLILGSGIAGLVAAHKLASLGTINLVTKKQAVDSNTNYAQGGIAAVVATYFLYDNARHRIDAFLGGGTAYDQVDLAARTLSGGGWTGTGLWLGTRKLALPEAHTDYIFSVIGEEFGLWVCAAIVVLYLALVTRVLLRLTEEEDLFTLLAATGLTAQLGAPHRELDFAQIRNGKPVPVGLPAQ
jgi:cell division protein FtsW (lipid II flippase)